MKNNKFLRFISTRAMVVTIFVILIVMTLIYWYLLIYAKQNIDTINKLIDTILKSLAILIGFIWFLNRYYTERKDINKFDIQLDFNSVQLESGNCLLIYRLDLFNLGNSLFEDYVYTFQIDGFREEKGKVIVEVIQKLPEQKEIFGLPIEPGSWTAINSEKIINNEYKALRFYYEIKKSDKILWTWHKTYKINTATNRVGCPTG